jgi:hypothetical protein
MTNAARFRGLVGRVVPTMLAVGVYACTGGHDAGGVGGSDGADSGVDVVDASARDIAPLPSVFQWTSTGPLVAPIPNDTHPIVSVKDPSVVFFNGLWHIYATTANTAGQWSIVYLNFPDWSQAAAAQPYYLDDNPVMRGYHAAPQVFFFRPQQKWYLIFQSGQPQYTTTDDLSHPETWAAPQNFFSTVPATVTNNQGAGTWLDFWTICDDARCHLFFTDDNGDFYRSDTDIQSFPQGFGEPVVVMKASKSDLFEGGATYHVGGRDQYLTMIEAFGPTGHRYYRSFVADNLEGEWTPLADTWTNPFAGINNVTFDDGVTWTNDVSHGELLRDGYDETLTIDPGNLGFLYQGVDPTMTGVAYSQLPYRLALLTLVQP